MNLKRVQFAPRLGLRLASALMIPGLCFTAVSAPLPGAALLRDWRHHIPVSAYDRTAAGEWTLPLIQTPFPYNELVYAWHLNHPGDCFRLFLKASFAPGDETAWLYAGYWGRVRDPATNRKTPKFDRGVLDMDWLKLTTSATAFRFKVVAAGTEPLLAPPALSVVATGARPETSSPSDAPDPGDGPPIPGRVLDVPLRRQFDSQGRRMKDRCQSAALASAMEYYGKSVPLEDITKYTYDAEYDYPGIWPRVIAAAREFGFEGYIDRFRDWSRVRQALAENKVLLCSIRLREGECKAPPYGSMGNHIVALCGLTDDGRVVVTDSALGKSGAGYLCQWLQSDFETVWMRTKGGIALVICPPAGSAEHLVRDVPPFPTARKFPAGDDH